MLLRRCCPTLAVAALLVTLTSPSTHASDLPALVGVTASPTGEYVTRPDIDPPTLTTSGTGEQAPGLLFTTPGTFLAPDFEAVVYDDRGELVWWGDAPAEHSIFDLEPVTFRGEPALVYWEGSMVQADGSTLPDNEYVVLDDSYREIVSFSAGNGYATDSHDIEFSPDGSRVLLAGFRFVPYDLSPYGGPADATLVDMVVQEQDVATGEITFEWNALEHIPLTETEESFTEHGEVPFAFDFFHFNALDYDTDGDLLISGRNTSTVYKVDRETGEIVWRFGGANSDFAVADPAALPSYQHDVYRLPDGRLSMFDNGNRRTPQYSRGVVYELDEETMTAELVRDVQPAEQTYGFATGSMRRQENGNQLVSYADTGLLEEYDAAGPVFTATFEADHLTYRAERAEWRATPATPPDAALGEPAEDGSRTVYASWNGATEVVRWRIEAGPTVEELRPLGTTPSLGFETAVQTHPPDDAQVFRVTALDASGAPLGSRTLTQ
ncbi:arylsulfotransferase family protein [Streptomyces sp. B6B3]|uniref:arylsulfotransferase family protein n=1 Tax=Streptomyces sp. B6B3 TaxID=3153570 RepID=UPI00325D25F7